MANIIEAGNVPENERVYLKKDFLGWRVVEPIKDPETKEILWKNVFSKKGFFNLVILLLILGMVYLGYNESITNYKEVMTNPCSYCKDCQEYVTIQIQGINDKLLNKTQKLNFSILK